MPTYLSETNGLQAESQNLEFTINDGFFEKVDSLEKAYILGLFTSNLQFTMDCVQSVVLHLDKEDIVKLESMEQLGYTSNANSTSGNVIQLTIDLKNVLRDMYKHLKICDSKCAEENINFPDLENDNFKWSFIRGYFDGKGLVGLAKHHQNEFPMCSITINSESILNCIKEFSRVPCNIESNKITWYGINTIDFLSKMYNGTTLYTSNKFNIYNELRNWKPNSSKKLPKFKYVLSDNAVKPQKNRESDAGYDLHLIRKIKEENGVIYYDTGVKIKPDFGYYCELVGRSSIAKTGYMLANSIGIIDAGYNGNIIVALIKVNTNAAELSLPNKLVQIIPREQISLDMEETDSLEETLRNDAGGLGSKNIY